MRRVVTAIAGLLIGLSACSGGSEGADPPVTSAPPTTPDTASTSAAPTTPTPTGPTPPPMPAEAATHDEAGAKAFVRYFWRLVDYSETTGDTQLIRDLSDPGCSGCQRGIENVEGIYERGGKIVGGESAVSNMDVEMRYAGSLTLAVVSFTMTMTPQETNFPDESQNKRDEGGSYDEHFELVATETGWKVSQFRTLS